jgi:hypothetical protein
MGAANMTVPLDAIFTNTLLITVSSVVVIGAFVLAIAAVAVMLMLRSDH